MSILLMVADMDLQLLILIFGWLHTIDVRDANGCIFSTSVNINSGNGPTIWISILLCGMVPIMVE
jgi:hypothetical protein